MKKLITLLTGLLFVALSVGLTGCDDSDEQVNRPDERFVSGVVIPTALDVCEGLEMTIEGQGFRQGDAVTLRGDSDMPAQTTGITPSSISFVLPDGLEDQTAYKFLLVRNGELQYYDVDGSYNRARLKSVGELPDFPNAFDPDRLGDREVLFMGTHSYMGIGASDMQGLAIACSPGSPQWTLYTFSDDGLYYGSSPRCPAVTTFTPSAGHRAEEWSFATSCFYNNVFFYGSGNRVYRVDLNSTIRRAAS